jgi:hypothetical protein|tara:strand:- start:545 stop:928 length:384 start_codon:yes stop_codon:yes gene_type:complete
MKEQKQKVREYVLERLDEGVGEERYACDLHHYLVNEDYFIIGTWQAEQFLGDAVWDAIRMIQDYEQQNFGECTTDLSEPEKVANMFAYIVGEEILGESEHLRENWDRKLDKADLARIREELSGRVEA